MSELVYRSAVALATAVRNKEVSSQEIVDACLKRINEVNPALNAVVQIDAASARAQAKQADDELARGCIRGPLHGLPMTIKDSLDTAGMVTTGGTVGRIDYLPKRDATVARGCGAKGGTLYGAGIRGLGLAADLGGCSPGGEDLSVDGHVL